MKKTLTTETRKADQDDIKSHYDFDYGKAKPNRFAQIGSNKRRVYRDSFIVTVHKADGTTDVRQVKPLENSVILDPDVQQYFPDAESVNAALRALIALAPHKRRAKPRSA